MSNQQIPEKVETVSIQPADQTSDTGKPYTPPVILHELALETRAGSALGVDPLKDLFGIESK